MFKDYVATKNDLEAVEEALDLVLKPEMRFVFSDLSKIEKTSIVSFDSLYIYVWQINPVKSVSKIQHNLTIPEGWQSGWWASIVSKKIEKYLPTKDRDPIISGGLLTPFITLQKTKNMPGNPYITRESYLATIVHEFGHIYWNSYKLWWHSNKKENIRNLHLASSLYTFKERPASPKDSFYLTSPMYLGEVFAYCTEYFVSEYFLKNHKKNLDAFSINHLDKLINLEKDKNLEKEDSVIEPNNSPHDFAIISGKTILTNHPNDWPKILTQPLKL